MIQPIRLRFGLLIVACTACQTVSVPPTPSPNPSPTALSPTPVPPIQVISHQLLPGSAPGEWRVVGLIENEGQAAVSQIELTVSIMNEAGETIAEISTRTLMSNLFPGEAGPFSVTFNSATAPADVSIELLAFAPQPANGRRVDHQRAELVSELEEFFNTENGELAALGFVTNPGHRHVSLDSLSFLARGPDGSEELVAEMRFGPNRLAPGETAPFVALAPQNPGTVRWTQYHDGVITEAPGADALEIRGDPQLHLTAQGAPFVVGTLANSGLTATTGSVLVSLFDGDRLIALWETEIPRILRPGEQLAFTAFGFPGVSLRFDPGNADAIRVETRVEEQGVDETKTAVVLPVDVSTFHSVGSAIFIRGTIRNPTASEVEAATVYAELRSSLGELMTAGWSVVESLKPGGAGEFVLDLPIPAGMDVTLTEYDLRAIGLEAQP